MSRSGYTDGEAETTEATLRYGRWRAQVASAIRGNRGQAFLRDLIAALDALPEHVLIDGLVEQDGCYCAIGALARHRGVDLLAGWREQAKERATAQECTEDDAMAEILDEESDDWIKEAASHLDAARQLVAEVIDENDSSWVDSDEERWARVRAWAVRNLKGDP